ncbi:glycerate kinase [Corynebacterium pygosceleis]|uniref:glycerate kinase n=1 Tax=Corynebacterium pygosceleis TaxID=2800406 RepID=UPI0019064C8A|nr:glycerate kinase [Corynebacterium pygosceleis]MCL0120505.1 glycerate kinase [Corynebacterium pygosceleis]
MDTTPNTPDARTPHPTVVLAPDSFKGTATGSRAAEWIGAGFTEVCPDSEVILAPMADGGEGTSACFSGEVCTLPTVTAAGRLTEASYVFDADGGGTGVPQAYIDIAAASGLPAVADSPVPGTGDTFGTGVLIADAVSRGAAHIILGLGGSATVDGGTGILIALGAQPLDGGGRALPQGGEHLTELADIDTAQLNVRAAAVEWTLLADVTAPATGPEGAATVFGPQKGADPELVGRLDAGLAHLCSFAGIDPQTPGYGAAGAVPVGLHWLSSVVTGGEPRLRLLPGARTVAESVGLPGLISGADLVVTGEGRVDGQSFRGKVVGTVLDIARDTDTPAAVIAGRIDTALPDGVTGIQLRSPGADGHDRTAEQLREAGRRLAERYLETRTDHG